MRIAVFLGAGFGVAAGYPCTSQLFDDPRQLSHSARSRIDIDVTYQLWREWRMKNPLKHPEVFISEMFMNRHDASHSWESLVRFLGYRLGVHRPRACGRTYDSVFARNPCEAHRDWWSSILSSLRSPEELTVVTTNWDVLVERSLFPRYRPEIGMPGINYGWRSEIEANATSGGLTPHTSFPLFAGLVPLLKLHGSLNWSEEHDRLVQHGHLVPAYTGRALIIPPVEDKSIPQWLKAVWTRAHDALASADTVIVAGYSFPPYDERVMSLFQNALSLSKATLNVFDPNAQSIVARLRTRVAAKAIRAFPGLPDG